MILQKELIFDRIKDSGYYFWTLFLQQGFKNTSHLMTYTGNDFEESDTHETKIEKSINRLKAIVDSFPPDAVFVIEIKNSKNANGSGIIGQLQFSNAQQAQIGANAQPQTTMLNGIPESYLKGVEDRLQKEFQISFENWKAEERKKQIEREFERREAEIAEKEKNLKELQKGYESGVAKTADVLVEAAKKIINYFMPEISSKKQASANVLSGTQQTTKEDIKDVKADKVDEYAAYLYNNFSVNEIDEKFKTLKNDVENKNTAAKQ